MNRLAAIRLREQVLRRKMEERCDHRYDDIIHMPHHVSDKRDRMPLLHRAAQFSPFAALAGYDEMIKETSRFTDKRRELDEYEKAVLDEKLRTALSFPGAEVTIT